MQPCQATPLTRCNRLRSVEIGAAGKMPRSGPVLSHGRNGRIRTWINGRRYHLPMVRSLRIEFACVVLRDACDVRATCVRRSSMMAGIGRDFQPGLDAIAIVSDGAAGYTS